MNRGFLIIAVFLLTMQPHAIMAAEGSGLWGKVTGFFSGQQKSGQRARSAYIAEGEGGRPIRENLFKPHDTRPPASAENPFVGTQPRTAEQLRRRAEERKREQLAQAMALKEALDRGSDGNNPGILSGVAPVRHLGPRGGEPPAGASNIYRRAPRGSTGGGGSYFLDRENTQPAEQGQYFIRSR